MVSTDPNILGQLILTFQIQLMTMVGQAIDRGDAVHGPERAICDHVVGLLYECPEQRDRLQLR